MRVPTSFRCLLTLLALAVLALPCPAQDSGRRRPVPELNSTDRSRLAQLRAGSQAVSGDNDIALLKTAAQFYVNRLTEAKYHRKSTLTDHHLGMHDLVAEAKQAMPLPEREMSDNQQQFMKDFTKALLVEIKEVLHNPEPIAQVNAAQILAHLGKLGQDDALDLMVEIIDPAKPYSDVVRIWALHGLEDLFERVRPRPPAREQRAIQALLDFVNQSPKLTGKEPRDVVNAFRYFRRQAIRALGRTRVPGDTGGKPPTALVLLRFMRKDGFKPEPSVSEQVEAAIGACQLHSKLYSDYQPDYTVHQVGEFIVDFVDAYARDLTRTDPEHPASEGWKYHAARLIKALEALRIDTRERDKHVLEVTEKAMNLLKQVSTGSTTVEGGNFRRWLDKNPPTEATSVYKDVPGSVVKPPESSDK
ncbi:MAG TPA: hypothetical protein VG013_14220 [Gemmataceae bacterium]|jgi:hypothetical protein|nr:hypothetical protein [Gemmataceae bacterium]